MWRKLIPLLIFSLAFALTEAATAYYLKTVTGLYTFNSLPRHADILNLGFVQLASAASVITSHKELFALEGWRETATMIVLLGVSFLAGKDFRKKLGAFLISFAVWDIFYYIFLKIFTGWPQSVWDTDVFLINPVAVVGPVVVAIILSLTVLVLGGLLFCEKGNKSDR